MTAKRIRVLHVDDNADARALLSILLSLEEDLEEVGSHHDAEGLEELVRKTSPDVLVIDLTMPGKDPVEAIRQVRAEFPALRIVVMSGSIDPKLLARARAAGASELALKACDISETLAVIRGTGR